MIRRRRTTWSLIVVAASALAPDGPARASGLATYSSTITIDSSASDAAHPHSATIVNTSPAGTAPVTEIDALIQPPGSVDAPLNTQNSPMTVLSGSSGFDAKNLTFKLGNNPSNQNVALGFVFDPTSGFAPGAVLPFSLNTSGPATLTLIDPATGKAPTNVAFATFTAPTSGGTGSNPTPSPPPGSGTPQAHVPEPISLALWSAAAGFGLLRARAFRRARQAAF